MNVTAAHIPPAKGQRLRWPLIWSAVVIALLGWGSHAHLERYITPQRGVGYWLGIIGGSMMLLLLALFGAQTLRVAALDGRDPELVPVSHDARRGRSGAGAVSFQFQARRHQQQCRAVLHAGGRRQRRDRPLHLYAFARAAWTAMRTHLQQLKAVGERLRSQTTSIAFLPGLLDAIETHRAAL